MTKSTRRESQKINNTGLGKLENNQHPGACKSFYQVVCFIQLSEAGVLSVSLKMDKSGYRAVKKVFVKEGLTPNEVDSNFIEVYRDSSPSFSTIKKRAAEFKRGCTSLESHSRSKTAD